MKHDCVARSLACTRTPSRAPDNTLRLQMALMLLEQLAEVFSHGPHGADRSLFCMGSGWDSVKAELRGTGQVRTQSKTRVGIPKPGTSKPGLFLAHSKRFPIHTQPATLA